MDYYEGKKTVIAGGLGLVGRQLSDKLLERGAEVKVVDLAQISESERNSRIEYLNLDLTEYRNCSNACNGMDIAFNLMCHKGSPKMMAEQPASHFVPPLLYNTNFMRAAHDNKVENFLFTSTVGVYENAEVFKEEDVWNGMPSKKDWYAGWAKRMGELQAEAYKEEFGWDKISIVRPSNVYGTHDNFDPETAMFVSAIIAKSVRGDNPLKVFGDGTNVRDFIHAKDVADGMLYVVENNINDPVNIGNGEGYSVKEIVDTVVSNLATKPEIFYDTSVPSGDLRRVSDISKLKDYGFSPKISLEEGILDVMDWYEKTINR